MKKVYNLFLDDERVPANAGTFFEDKPKRALFFNLEWVIVRDYNAFVTMIKENGLPELISFDHDLGFEMTGFDCAKWLVEYCMDNDLKTPEYMVHSRNPVGVENISGLLDNFKLKYENQC